MLNACFYDANEIIVEALLEAGADVNKSNKSGGTPLSVALICKNDISIIKLLLKAGANVNARTLCGSTPLIFAVRNQNSLGVIRELLHYGADINSSMDSKNLFDGYTALHFAVREKQNDIAQFLVRSGANIHAKTKGKNNKTPLDIASVEIRCILINERDIQMKKQQIVVAISKVKPSNISVMDMIKKKASHSIGFIHSNIPTKISISTPNTTSVSKSDSVILHKSTKNSYKISPVSRKNDLDSSKEKLANEC